MLGEDMGNYTLASTTNDVGKNGRPKQRGIIGVSIMEPTMEMKAKAKR